MKTGRINVAIADDHPVVRKGISDVVQLCGEFEIVIEASDGKELIDQLQGAEVLPDICVLDINMPNMNGYCALREIKQRWDSIKVLIFSDHSEEFSICEMMHCGANGYLEKNCSTRVLQQALATIYYHDYYLVESTARTLSARTQNNSIYRKITCREMEFLTHSCSELSYKEIAERMGVSVRTVEAFRDALFTKLALKTRTGLAMFALRNGIVA